VAKSNSDSGRSEAKTANWPTKFSKLRQFIRSFFSAQKRPIFPETLLPQPGPPVQPQHRWRFALFPLRRRAQTVARELRAKDRQNSNGRNGLRSQSRTDNTKLRPRIFSFGTLTSKSSFTFCKETNNGLVGAAVFHSKQLGQPEKTEKTQPDWGERTGKFARAGSEHRDATDKNCSHDPK
jgi:hypothetical protein